MARVIWWLAITIAIAAIIAPEIAWLIVIALFFSGALPLYVMFWFADVFGDKPGSENNRIY